MEDQEQLPKQEELGQGTSLPVQEPQYVQVSDQQPSTFQRFSVKTFVLILLSVLLLGGGVWAGVRFWTSLQVTNQSVELTWWGLWDKTVVQPIIDQYESQHQQVKINYLKQSTKDYRARLASSLTRGNGPDIFRFHNTWVPMFSSELASWPQELMGKETFSAIFYPVASRDLVQAGRLVAIPLMFDGLGLYVNDEIFRSAKKEPPITWDELRRVAADLTVKDAQGAIIQAGVALGTAGNVDHWEDVLALMLLQNGASPAHPVGKLAEDVILFYTLFVTDDKVWDQTLPASTLAFSQGRLAMYFAPSARAAEIKSQNPNLSFRIVPVPQLPKTSPQEPDITWASYWVEGVWARSKKAKEAFAFLKFMSEKEQLQKLYQNLAFQHTIGEPYSRPDMADLLKDDLFLGAYVRQAPTARSWYLASQTFDGSAGINSQVAQAYRKAINGVLGGKLPNEVLETLEDELQQALALHGVK